MNYQMTYQYYGGEYLKFLRDLNRILLESDIKEVKAP